MTKKTTVETVKKIEKELKSGLKVKRGFAVVNSHLEFLTKDERWSSKSTQAHVTVERLAVKKAEEFHGKVTAIEVLVSGGLT